ncbi:TPA: hypothetical protein OL464_003718 [Clostridioides difficile]|nr:hypothetical protein [Clostridioides difficile]
MCKFAFDNIFLDVPKSATSISALGSLVQGSIIDLKNYAPPFEIGFSNFKVVCDRGGDSGVINIQIPYADGSGFFTCGDYYTNLTLLDKYRITSIKMQGYKTILNIEFYMLPSQWVPGGSVYRGEYVAEKPLVGLAYDLPYVPGTYDWDGQVSDKVSDSGLDIYVPVDSSDLVGVPSDDVFIGENNPPYDLPTSGTVTVPKVENPSLDVGDNIVIPGDSVVDPPVDPPIDPPINPDVPIVGIDFGPLVDAMSNFKDKFPFSLPWDLGRIFQTFDVTPKAPVWEVTLISAKFTIDMTIFEKFFDISRFFIYLSFLVSLIFISVKLKN